MSLTELGHWQYPFTSFCLVLAKVCLLQQFFLHQFLPLLIAVWCVRQCHLWKPGHQAELWDIGFTRFRRTYWGWLDVIKANAKRNSKSERTYPCLIPVAMSKLSVGCSLCKTRSVKVFLMMLMNLSGMPQCFSSLYCKVFLWPGCQMLSQNQRRRHGVVTWIIQNVLINLQCMICFLWIMLNCREIWNLLL